MRTIFVCLAGLLWAGLLGGFMRRQWEIEKVGLGELFKHVETVPMVVLSFGTWIFLALLAIVDLYMRTVPGTLHAFPPLFGTEHPSRASRQASEKIAALIILILLPVRLLWFWGEFLEHSVS